MSPPSHGGGLNEQSDPAEIRTLSLFWLLLSLRKICYKMAEKCGRHHSSICLMVRNSKRGLILSKSKSFFFMILQFCLPGSEIKYDQERLEAAFSPL